MAVGAAPSGAPEFVMYVGTSHLDESKNARQTRRTAVVAGILSVAMVAGVALAYMQPSRVEMFATSASNSADASLEAELLKAAPHATVAAMLKDLSAWKSRAISSGQASQMLSSGPVTLAITPELADASAICAKKDMITEKFSQLLTKLGNENIARNASDQSVYDEQEKALQAWLDAEALYRLTTEKSAEAEEGAKYARAQYEKWAATVKATEERSAQQTKSFASERLAIATERDMVTEVMKLIGVLQSQPASEAKSVGSQAVLKELNEKVFELKQKAMSDSGLKMAKVQKLSSQLADVAEAGEVKGILEDMLKDLDLRDQLIAQNEAKTAEELVDHKAKLVKYETELVDLSNAADKAKQSADAADLKRQGLAGAKRNTKEAYTDEHAAFLIVTPPAEREITIVKAIQAKINAFCVSGDSAAK